MRGVLVVKELTENTCMWTRAQQVDLKIALPANIIDFAAKQQLAFANRLQEEFRRNGKEIDRERVVDLAGKMRLWSR